MVYPDHIILCDYYVNKIGNFCLLSKLAVTELVLVLVASRSIKFLI